MLILKNDRISLTIDDQARLIAFENLETGLGNLVHTPSPLFRLVLNTGCNWEDVAYAKDADLSLSADGDTATIRVRSLTTRMGTHDIRLTLTIRLDGDKVWFGSSIDNRSESTVVDFVYPMLGGFSDLGGEAPGLLIPYYYGEYHTDIIASLRASTMRDGRYELAYTYPGYLSMAWMALMSSRYCLFVTSLDRRLHATSFQAASRAESEIVLELDRMAFAAPGKVWEGPETLLWLYEGSWQPGAELYRDWVNANLRRRTEPKPWMRDMNGYFLVIEKQQFGDILWPYKQIPALYETAKQYGCDALGLFGWYETGHDNNYPDLEVSQSMGGEQLLRDGIRAVHEQGGHVTLYYQGHLLDLNSPYYKAHGQEVECQSRWLTPYFEQYNKFCSSDFLRHFTCKAFATACPGSTQWQELMAEKADWIASLGADAVLYDQIGGRNPTPCFNPRHHHETPSFSYSQGRVDLLSRIRHQVDTHPDYAFMTENMTDVYAQFIDCVHGTGTYPDGVPGARASYVENKRPMMLRTPGLYRHCFPEDISTERNWRPYMEPRTVNFSICYGLRLEMELRTLKDLELLERDDYPEWRAYAKAAADLRLKYADLLLHGTYSCDASLTRANPAVFHGVFTAQGKRCVVLWNDSSREIPLHLEGWDFTRWETPTASGDGVPASIPADSMLVLF